MNQFERKQPQLYGLAGSHPEKQLQSAGRRDCAHNMSNTQPGNVHSSCKNSLVLVSRRFFARFLQDSRTQSSYCKIPEQNVVQIVLILSQFNLQVFALIKYIICNDVMTVNRWFHFQQNQQEKRQICQEIALSSSYPTLYSLY